MKGKKGIKILITILSILLVVTVIGLATYYIMDNKTSSNSIGDKQEKVEEIAIQVETPKEIEIYKGTDRPVAVMIDNNVNAWPQYELNKAYVVYEIIVEGLETRLMAIFKNADVDMIGPIRSSRHYFLDYALENDAIYAHLGWSPQAQKDIASLGVNNINGQVYDTGSARTEISKYWRDQTRYAPHNAFTSLSALYEISEDKGYRTTSEEESVLNYVSKEVELDSDIIANTVSIPYSDTHIVKFEYDSELGKYVRYSKGVKQTDGATGEDIVTKNIIVAFMENYTLPDEEKKGRQGLRNIGTADGYYITNGKAIKIKCEKNSRTEKTVYKDLDGNEIEVNDGNTFIEICPLHADVQIN
ncbi:MAG: DUF3048 domain-containing protein [Clostridia bacterium]|nr:DUF3048 domain-containing protein [Clostridia bacterium]